MPEPRIEQRTAAFALTGHCAGCDQDAETRLYRVRFTSAEPDAVEYCADCADLTRLDNHGETESIEPIGDDALCLGCSAVVGGPVLREYCSSLTHPMGKEA